MHMCKPEIGFEKQYSPSIRCRQPTESHIPPTFWDVLGWNLWKASFLSIFILLDIYTTASYFAYPTILRSTRRTIEAPEKATTAVYKIQTTNRVTHTAYILRYIGMTFLESIIFIHFCFVRFLYKNTTFWLSNKFSLNTTHNWSAWQSNIRRLYDADNQ